MGNSSTAPAGNNPGPDPHVFTLPPCDDKPPPPSKVNEWLALLFGADGHAIEIRAPDYRQPGGRVFTVVSRFRPGAIEPAAREALRLSGHAPAVYVLLNGASPTLPFGRNLRKTGDQGPGATAANVPRRRWLLIDCDPVRPGTVNATDAEKAAALAVALAIRAALVTLGWPEPIIADSGNGYHLLFRIDLPADTPSTELVKRVLAALAAGFNTPACHIDTVVFDLPRLVKCYGTHVCKGEDTPERPARYARLLSAPTEPTPVPVELLEAIAAEAPAEPATPAGFDLAAEVERKRGQAESERGTATDGKPRPGTGPDAEARAAAYLATCEPAISGQGGHDKTFLVACTIAHGFKLGSESVFRLLRDHYNDRCEPPWNERELRHKADDAVKSEPKKPPGWLLDAPLENTRRHKAAPPSDPTPGHGRQAEAEGPPHVIPPPNGDGHGQSEGPTLDETLSHYPRTDLGNAERLVARHGGALRYCHPWKSWLAWDGRRWHPDDTAEARRRARATARKILAEAAAEPDDERRKELVKWALASEKRERIGAMLYLAEAEEGIPILPADMDSDPWAFNVLNGTIDLRTGELRPHRQADRITKLCPLEFDPDARCPRWLATLDKFFHRADATRKAELIDYWQRLCGYAMAGVIRDHVMPVAYGIGANGKSTMLGALLDVFGPDYAMKAAPDMFMAKKTDSHPTDRADLFGKRLVVAIETEAGRRLNETMVKELTGGDRIRARRMREDFWEFSPTHTLIMATNHKPGIRGTDTGIWRRIKLVPFTVSVSDAEADKGMPDKLRAEAAGILAWCVKGCLEWQRRGLDAPAEVTEATAGYRAEQDLIGLFLDQCVDRGPALKVKAGDLYQRYKTWAESGNEHVMTLTRFGEAIRERGIESRKSSYCWYLEIGLKDDPGRGRGSDRETGAV